MAFIDDRFLLENDTAVRLYQAYAAPQPIFDYHCHLSPRQIAENRRFSNLFEIWLEGDHYKWRAMRVNGEPEQFCTGNATPYEKFLAWARTVPYTLRNPLYHWTHLELQRYFGITELLDETSAPRIWDQANSILQSHFDAHAILQKFNVHTIGTTDDPADSLEYHAQIAASSLPTRVVPAFRPDAALRVDAPLAFQQWINRLAFAANREIDSLASFLDALEQRLKDFHAVGCRLSDHGLDVCYAESCSDKLAAEIYADALTGVAATPERHDKFASYILHFLGQLYARHEWTMQLHLGALRNVNSRARSVLGPDTGFDTIGGAPQLTALAKFLDKLEQSDSLPRTILYNSNPVENYAFATLVGGFSAENLPGKVQFGSGWWFLDQKEGMEWQLNALSNANLLSRFVGMVTDSRSFMSYPRHEYFRRILCNMLGGEMEKGLLPNDEALVGRMVRDISFGNANRYFGLPRIVRASEAGILDSTYSSQGQP
jgi:glucuronate isomerase